MAQVKLQTSWLRGDLMSSTKLLSNDEGSVERAMQILIANRKLRFRFMKHDSWENALFVHWPVDPAVMKANLPKGLEPDLYNGLAWVGLVLLTERGVSAHQQIGRALIRPIDHFGANVRTYVTRHDVPGIYFWSLECTSILASFGARLAGIPYFPANMSRTVDIEHPLTDPATSSDSDFVFTFESRRSGFGQQPTVSARWRLGEAATEGVEDAKWTEKARFFVERYSVYCSWPLGKGPVLLRGDVEHPSWPLQHAIVDALDAEPLLAAAGLPHLTQGSSNEARHVCFSRGVGPVEFWMLEPV
uniref:Uncharacterized protein n=1 Tax=Noctiluca scintillans TaxID=2966 RepID=A0A7S1B1A6_NOCSC